MRNLESLALRYYNHRLWVLDQQQLPQSEIWLQPKTAEELVQIIRCLQIRGAPLIGISAALMLGHLASQRTSESELLQAAELLRAARPTAVNLNHCIDRMLSQPLNQPELWVDCAEKLFAEDIQLCQKMAFAGAELVGQDETILTICNTGSLATVGLGTAFGVIHQSHSEGKNPFVYAMETRPLLQGGRLTAWELTKRQIPFKLLPDSAIGALMQNVKIDRVVVGADRIAANGDTANKIGTYTLAVLAQRHNIPFYVVAPYTTVDPACKTGLEIDIEHRKDAEVLGVTGAFGSVRWAPEAAQTFNPAFDVTPMELITGWILDCGIFTATDVKSGCFAKATSRMDGEE